MTKLSNKSVSTGLTTATRQQQRRLEEEQALLQVQR